MRSLIAGAALLLLAVGCGDDANSDPPATPTETVTVTAEPDIEITEPTEAAPEPTGPAEPNVGDTALNIGDTRQGTEVATTVFEVEFPFPPGTYRTPGPGNDFLGIRVQQCLAKSATEEAYSTYTGDFAAVTPNGTEFAGSGSSWNDWPAPKFPENVTLVPGRCIKGWIANEVPEGTKIDALLWRPGGVTTAEWLLK